MSRKGVARLGRSLGKRRTAFGLRLMRPGPTSIDSTLSVSEWSIDVLQVLRQGCIAVTRDCDTKSGPLRSARVDALGDVMKPVSLPGSHSLGTETAVISVGEVKDAKSWHHDQSFVAKVPDWSILQCEDPGEKLSPTAFCDGAELFDQLSEGFRTMLRSLNGIHRAEYEADGYLQDSESTAVHPVVVDLDGRECLFISPAAVRTIDSWTDAESDYLLRPLFDAMNWPELVYVHEWQAGDVVVWPNRRFVHRALPGGDDGYRRLFRSVGHWRGE